MHFIHNPYVTAFDVVGSNNGKTYELITSYKNLNFPNQRVLFEYRQPSFYNRIRINFMNDSWGSISGSMFEFDIFGTYIRFSLTSCPFDTCQPSFSFIYYCLFILL